MAWPSGWFLPSKNMGFWRMYGDKVKVSPLAMSILFPSGPDEKQNAINEAAFKPPLFAAIKEEWEG